MSPKARKYTRNNDEPPAFVLVFLFLSLLTVFSLPFVYLYLNQQGNKKVIEVFQTVDLKWPIYPFFDDDKVNNLTSRPDPFLMDKILNDIAYMKTPVFKLNGSKVEQKIPRIIHQSWRTEAVPHVVLPWIKKWKEIHPDWTYIFWTDVAADSFIKRYYPDIWEFYKSWTLPVQKSDMFRILAVYAFGGIWADIDMEPLKNLDPVRDWSACVLAKHPLIQTYLIDNQDRGDIYATNYTYPINAFFGCRPGHPFMFYLLSRLVESSPRWARRKCDISSTVACSGPRLMALAHAFYLRSIPENTRRNKPDLDVICPDADYFMPTYDTTYKSNTERVKHLCHKPDMLSDIQRKLCQDFNNPEQNAVKNISYAVHKWFHSYKFGKRTMYYRGKLKLIVPFNNYYDQGLFEIVDGYEYQKSPS